MFGRSKREQVERAAQEIGMTVKDDGDCIDIEDKRTRWRFKKDDQGLEEAKEALRVNTLFRRRPGR